MSKAKTIIPSVIGAIVIAGVVAFSASPALRTWLQLLFWSGKSTLRCSGNQSITLKNKTADITGQVIYASGNCKVKLVNCNFRSSIPVYASGNARITIQGGKYEGSSQAVYLGGQASLIVKGGTFAGESQSIYAGSSGKIVLQNAKLRGNNNGLYVGSRASVVIRGGELRGNRQALYIGSNAQVEVTGTPIESTRSNYAVYVGSGAKLTMSGGSIKGPSKSIYAGSRSTVTLVKGVKVEGKWYKSSTASVGSADDIQAARSKADAAKARKEMLSRYSKGACQGVVDCFKRNGAFGSIGARVTMKIGQDGKVEKVSLRVRRGGKKVRRCIEAVAKEHLIADFRGPTGKLLCNLSGTLTRGSQMLHVSQRYLPDKAPRPAQAAMGLDLPTAPR